MLLLHTADWHLGDRIGSRGIDRTADLRRAVEHIAGLCDEHKVDVLLVAGDLFSERLRLQEDLGDTIAHLSRTFQRFMVHGGTVVAITGNHDREIPCQTLRNTLSLAAPRPLEAGDLVAPGRLYLAVKPTFFRLGGRDGTEVQFVLMPYPTPARYSDGQGDPGNTREERNRTLQTLYASSLDRLMTHPSFRPDRPGVLSAHIHVQSASLRTLFRITEEQDVVFRDGNIPPGFAYVGLGHIHQPQCLGGKDHVRYSGSPERLDLGEQADEKGVVLVDIGPAGLRAAPAVIPVRATPFLDVVIDNPAEQVPRLRELYPGADQALVRYKLTWTPGVDRVDDLVRDIERAFPRWYERERHEAGTDREVGTADADAVGSDPADVPATVRRYLGAVLPADDPDREDLLKLADALLEDQP